MKKSLQYLIVLTAVLAAHLGVAAALMKASKTPGPEVLADSPNSLAPAITPAAPPEQKTKTPPPTTAKKEVQTTSPGGVTPAGPPLPNKAPDAKQENPLASPVSISPIGLPLPSDGRDREQPGGKTKGFTPEDRDIISKVLEDAVSPGFGEGPSAPADAQAAAAPETAETAVEAANANTPEKTDSPAPPAAPEMEDSPTTVATPIAPPETEQPPEQASDSTPAPTNEVASGSPAKKLIRDIDLKALEVNREEIEEKIKNDLPSAVEAFAPEGIDQNDIDAVIREAQTNLRQQMSGLKTQAPSGGNAPSSPASASPDP